MKHYIYKTELKKETMHFFYKQRNLCYWKGALKLEVIKGCHMLSVFKSDIETQH